MLQSKVKTLFNNQFNSIISQANTFSFKKSEKFHEQSIDLLNKFYDNKIKPNSNVLREVKQEIIEYNIRPEIIRFAINITKKFFVSKNDIEKKFYLKQLNTFNEYQYAFISALNINFNISYIKRNDYNHINIKHISKKLFHKKNAEKLSINITRTILISITQLCLLTHSELYELNYENSNANKLITNLILFLLNSNILINSNYFSITNLSNRNDLATKLGASSTLVNSTSGSGGGGGGGGNGNSSANGGSSNKNFSSLPTTTNSLLNLSSAGAKKLSFIKQVTASTARRSKSQLIIETIIKPSFEIILNLSDYYYDLMIRCSKYLKEFNYLLNKFKINNKNFYSNLTYILQITSLAYNRILEDKQVNACFERAKEIYHKSKIKEINEKYRLKIDIAKHRVERCKEELELARRALHFSQLRTESMERDFLSTTSMKTHINTSNSNYSSRFFYHNNNSKNLQVPAPPKSLTSSSSSQQQQQQLNGHLTTTHSTLTTTSLTSVETTRLHKCRDNLEKAELELQKLHEKRENLKNKFKINKSNINETSYREKIIPFLNGYHGTTLLTWDFVHSFIFNSYQTICIHLINILYKLIIKKFFRMNYKYKLANLWKLLINSFIIRIHAIKLAKCNQTMINTPTTLHDNFYTTQFQLLYQFHQYQQQGQRQQLQQQQTSIVNTIYADYDEINLNVELLNEIELYKKTNKVNYYDKCLISNCIDYFMKMRENNEFFYI